jgi:hypothetical protein
MKGISSTKVEHMYEKTLGGLGLEIHKQKQWLLYMWMWQEILHYKYFHYKMASQVVMKPTHSSFWKGLNRVRGEFLKRCVHG